jgi:hypothetical protein
MHVRVIACKVVGLHVVPQAELERVACWHLGDSSAHCEVARMGRVDWGAAGSDNEVNTVAPATLL